MTAPSGPWLAALLPTPLLRPVVENAAEGPLAVGDPSARSRAWCHWAVRSLRQFNGVGDQPYVAVELPGEFYERPGLQVRLKPHLQLPADTGRDLGLATRLACLGNSALAPLWIPPEVKAVKRALFSRPAEPATTAAFATALDARRAHLVTGLETLTSQLRASWADVAERMTADPAWVSRILLAGFDSSATAAYLDTDWTITVHAEPRLADQSGDSLGRRIGVWKLTATRNGTTASLAVTTPRLTRNSQLTDPMYAPDVDSSAALLVRALILRHVLGSETAAPRDNRGHLRGIPVRVGGKIPEAGAGAAAGFLLHHASTEAAWAALEAWAARSGAVLMSDRAGFLAGANAVASAVGRNEAPAQEAVNAVLPLAWGAEGSVVRLTYAKGSR